GGLVRGPGGSRSDSIPARLSNGEFVVNARATSKHLPLLEMINAGLDRFIGLADGGLARRVGAAASSMSSGFGDAYRELKVEIFNESGQAIEARRAGMRREGGVDIVTVVAGAIGQAAMSGKLGAFESLYGLKRR